MFKKSYPKLKRATASMASLFYFGVKDRQHAEISLAPPAQVRITFDSQVSVARPSGRAFVSDEASTHLSRKPALTLGLLTLFEFFFYRFIFSLFFPVSKDSGKFISSSAKTSMVIPTIRAYLSRTGKGGSLSFDSYSEMTVRRTVNSSVDNLFAISAKLQSR
jgi:hypothetical protein